MGSHKQIILVTGGNTGIGFETCAAVAAASADYHVILGSRSIEGGQQALRQILSRNPKGTLSLIQLDVNDDASVAAAANTVENYFGRVDVLVNNSSACLKEGNLRQQMAENFAINTIGPAVITEAFLPLLWNSTAPRLLYISSSLGSTGYMLQPDYPHSAVAALPYRVSKAGLNMLATYHHLELAPKGIKVFVLSPAHVATDLTDNEKFSTEMFAATKPKPEQTTLEASGQGLVNVINGVRDEDAGSFLSNPGDVGSVIPF